MKNSINNAIVNYIKEEYDNMNELIRKALDDASNLLEKQTPQTKTTIKSICIDDIMPYELTSFMKKNKIPDNVFFNSNEENGSIYLMWEVFIPTTEKDKLEYKRKRMRDVAFKFIYETLTKNGYERIPLNSDHFKKYRNFNIYDMYLNDDINGIVDYYSSYFRKVE